MKGSGTNFHVIGLLNDASLICPVMIQFEDDILKIHWGFLDDLEKYEVKNNFFDLSAKRLKIP
jgi:hypothetical protein